jgi:SNF2 family DNA or RNA helicase
MASRFMNPTTTGRIGFDIDVQELTEDHPRYTLPLGGNITLKPHQQTLLARCIQYENSKIMLKEFDEIANVFDMNDYCQTNVAVLADRVGAGKSYVILALLVANNITDKDNVIIKSHGFNKVMYYIHDKTTSIKTNLLVVPHNLAVQWEYYIKTFGGNLKHKIVKTQKALDALVAEVRDNAEDGVNSDSGESNTGESNTGESNTGDRSVASEGGDGASGHEDVRTTLDKIAEYDLIVVTSTLYNKLVQFFDNNKVKLQRAIFDEVDNLNVPGCKHVEANFIWFVTASYGNILYPNGHNHYEPSIGRYVWYANGIRHSGFLKKILMDLHYHVNHTMMKVLIVKNKEGYVESSLRLPELISHYIKCRTPYAINVLNGVVDRNILNHLNADDVQGALAYVNPSNKSNNEENIITRVIDKYTRQISNLRLQLSTAQQYQYDSETERNTEIQRLQRQLEQVERKVGMITERIKSNELCTICYDVADKKTVTSCCQNTFCFKCISIWIAQKRLCPLCKIPMDVRDLYVLDKEAEDDKKAEEDIEIDTTKPYHKLDKYENLEAILGGLGDDAKVLLFSAYENSFTNITKVLEKMSIPFASLKGNGYHIQATLERYRNGSVKVLLVNTQSYGSGLNMENTTDMILFHKFDTEIEKQVIGRAQRFGRSQPLHVHYLLYENEMPTGSSNSTSGAGASTSTA